MSRRVFACDANPLVDSRLYKISDKCALESIANGAAERVTLPDGRWAIRLLPTSQQKRDKSIGHSNLVPFGRAYNPLLRPPSLNYPVPHAGDVGMWRHFRRQIHVSSRKIDFPQAARTA
jgi:hypothetical protein